MTVLAIFNPNYIVEVIADENIDDHARVGVASLSSAPRPSGSQFRSWSLVVIGGPHCIDGHRWSSLVRSVYHHHVCSGKIVSSCRAQEERGLKPRSSHNLSTLRVILSTGGDLIIFILILVLLFTKAVLILESFRQTINMTLGLPTVIFLLTTNTPTVIVKSIFHRFPTCAKEL